jgi:hypothetical protein
LAPPDKPSSNLCLSTKPHFVWATRSSLLYRYCRARIRPSRSLGLSLPNRTWLEENDSYCCPSRSAGAGEAVEPSRLAFSLSSRSDRLVRGCNLFLHYDYSRSWASPLYITPITALIRSTSTINIIMVAHLLPYTFCRNAAPRKLLSGGCADRMLTLQLVLREPSQIEIDVNIVLLRPPFLSLRFTPCA